MEIEKPMHRKFSTDPDYKYWGSLDALKVSDLIALMIDVDPRQMQNFTVRGDCPVNSAGELPDLTDEMRLVKAAVKTKKLIALDAHEHPRFEDTYLSTEGLLNWLRSKRYTDLATALEEGSWPDDARISTVNLKEHATAPVLPVQRAAAQDRLILEAIKELGYDHDGLPKNDPGNSGVKFEVRAKLKTEPAFAASTSFNRAWQRLRDRGEISENQ
jgi:hypothetical protein